MSRSKNIGTWTETAVVKVLRDNGFPHAERRALAGVHDLGDVIGTPGVCWEVKGGHAAEDASDLDIEGWLAEAETERRNSKADIAVLVCKRRAVGRERAELWWALVRLGDIALAYHSDPLTRTIPVRMTLRDALIWLRSLGYGEAL